MSPTAMDRVAKFMNLQGLTWDQLAMRTHIPESRLTDLATGRQGTMTLNEAIRISRAVGVGLDRLYGDRVRIEKADEFLAIEMCHRLYVQLGPVECLKRLIPKRPMEDRPCSCSPSSPPA